MLYSFLFSSSARHASNARTRGPHSTAAVRQHGLSISGSGPKASRNVQIAVFAPVDPWHYRRSHRNQGESVGAHTASDAVCARAIRPLVGLVGRKCQGLFVAAEDQRRRAADNSPSEHPLPGARRTLRMLRTSYLGQPRLGQAQPWTPLRAVLCWSGCRSPSRAPDTRLTGPTRVGRPYVR